MVHTKILWSLYRFESHLVATFLIQLIRQRIFLLFHFHSITKRYIVQFLIHLEQMTIKMGVEEDCQYFSLWMENELVTQPLIDRPSLDLAHHIHTHRGLCANEACSDAKIAAQIASIDIRGRMQVDVPRARTIEALKRECDRQNFAIFVMPGQFLPRYRRIAAI